MNLNKLGTVLGTCCGKADKEFKNLMIPDIDEQLDGLGYVVYCTACGHLIADTEDGLDDIGGWAYGDEECIRDIVSEGDCLTLLDMWPDNVLIFETEENAIEAIKHMAARSDNDWTVEDFDIYCVYSVVRKVSALALYSSD